MKPLDALEAALSDLAAWHYAATFEAHEAAHDHAGLLFCARSDADYARHDPSILPTCRKYVLALIDFPNNDGERRALALRCLAAVDAALKEGQQRTP